ELLKSIKKFVFPFDPSFKSPIVDHFTFVLTDIDGKFKFGFCRLSEGSKLCHCVVSCHPWFEIFYRLLNQFSDLMNSHQVSYINKWIDSLLRINYLNSTEPASNRELTSSSVFVFQVPDATKLMSIPQSRNLTEYYCAVDSKNMMQIFASMLLERRIIVTSHKLSKLTACIHTAAHLLFPFHWQHIFIPILPPHLLDFCSAPMPFLIGIHTSLWNRINKDDLSDALVLDADANDILSEFNDLDHFPPDVLAKLKKYLNVKTKMKNLDGEIIPRAFLKVLVIIFGGYRTAFKMNEDKEIVFDSGLFLQSRPKHMKNFLQVVLQSQIFQQFIEERLNLIKAKKGYNDAFEAEISTYDSKRVKRKVCMHCVHTIHIIHSQIYH
ncbi:hypothetical protein HELRODRAFT_67031, partial [Helobdella robusta]|uniref:UDENN domain-containing protein n=1 Tax=Helobdella robusta TaxID=6412 RepID=T1FYV5_HELRO